MLDPDMGLIERVQKTSHVAGGKYAFGRRPPQLVNHDAALDAQAGETCLDNLRNRSRGRQKR